MQVKHAFKNQNMHLKNYKSIKITQNHLSKFIKNTYNSVMECITIWDGI